MIQTKYSLIVPCYKCVKYVRETLDSVLAQKVTDWELICVDDGSPDETGRTLDDYLREHCAAVAESECVIKAIGDEDRHPDEPKRILAGELPSGARMTVVHQQNCGVSGARNTGIAVARGEWLVYLDGDDLLSPQALEIVENCIAQVPDVDIVACGYVNFNDGEVFDWGERKGRVTAQDVSKVIPHDPFEGCFQRFVFRHETVKGIAYKGVSCTEEMGYMVKSFIRAKTLAKTDDVFYGYRVLVGSMSHRVASVRRYEDYFDLVRHVTKIISQSGKQIARSDARRIINRWFENHVYDMFCIKDHNERQACWDRWLQELPKILRYNNMTTRRQRVVVRLCLASRLKFTAFVLCYLPFWIKLHGLHR